ncbi:MULTISPECIES: hypothetical protein [Sorangium]|uniref:Uncharacterized protein n=1 Tax=Sorangium cellulosum TaxID=56 RepID=A0A4P2QP43_SORCE|nr:MULTISPECIES: hypothetical protein [Sorangium]AUX31917.1 uncharacterized protein SOCE836_040520 [Sorangium cellulosum]WCQ91291.1 hypothetical protein NQZ70_04007 [Sorangium sp. Soce836]
MAGWPTRISRSALGPTYTNQRPVARPDQQVGAKVLNLDFWTVAGLAGVGPQAFAVVNGGAGSFIARNETWNASGTAAIPAATRTGAGNYTITYPATVLDETGQSVAINLYGALVVPQTTSASLFGTALATSPNVIGVRIRNTSGTLTDSNFLLLVF